MKYSEFRDKVYSEYFEKHFTDYEWNTADPAIFERAEFGYRYNFGRYLAELPEGSSVLDVGCGIGHCLYWLSKEGYDVTGIDTSEEQIQEAKTVLEGEVTLKVADVFTFLRSGDRGYHAIIGGDFIEHLTRPEALEFVELARKALKPGGLLILRTPNATCPSAGSFYDDLTHERLYTALSLRQLLRTGGLRVEDVRSWESDPYRSAASLIAWMVKRVTWPLYKFRLFLHNFAPGPVEVGRNIVGVGRKPEQEAEDAPA